MSRSVALIALLLSSLVLYAGCAQPSAADPDPEPLVGTHWHAASIAGVQVQSGLVQSLRFEAGGQVTGIGGCHAFTGPYQLIGDQLTIGALAVKKRECDPKLQKQEERFVAALEETRRYELLPAGGLVLHPANGGLPSSLTLHVVSTE